MNLSTFKKVEKTNIKDPSQSWVIQQTNPGASSVTGKNNQLVMGWPTTSQIIYPGKTARLNTGVQSTQIGQNMQLTTIPMKGLLNYGLMSFDEVIDATDSRNGSQIVQVIQNSNSFPVKLQYTPKMGKPRITRLHPKTHEQLQCMNQLDDIDWGQLLTGIVTTAAHVIPMIL